jgi:hypothetical protein
MTYFKRSERACSYAVSELTILKINQATTSKANITHRDPRRDAGGFSVAKEYLIIMNANGLIIRCVVAKQTPADG